MKRIYLDSSIIDDKDKNILWMLIKLREIMSRDVIVTTLQWEMPVPIDPSQQIVETMQPV